RTIMSTDGITFVVAVNDRDILASNLLASPCFRQPHTYELLLQEGFTSATAAYNDGLRRSSNDLVIFVHQDVFLPEGWIAELDRALQYLQQTNPNWGVLGCWGTTRNGEYYGHIYSSGWGMLGANFNYPKPVQT